jgi:shikimate kinase
VGRVKLFVGGSDDDSNSYFYGLQTVTRNEAKDFILKYDQEYTSIIADQNKEIKQLKAKIASLEDTRNKLLQLLS